jgi:hypothetical protein
MTATKPREILLSELLTLHLDLAIKRYKDPDMDKRPPLTIPRPVELAGMRSRMLRAKQLQKDVAKTGEDYDAVLDGIDEAHRAIKSHVGDLKVVEWSLRDTIEGMIDRSNGGPSDGESDGRQSPSDHDEKGSSGEGKPEPPAAEVSVESHEVGEVKEAVGQEAPPQSFPEAGPGLVSSGTA